MFVNEQTVAWLMVWAVACVACNPAGPPPPTGNWEPIGTETEISIVPRDFRSDFMVFEGLADATYRGPSLSLYFRPRSLYFEVPLKKGLSLHRISQGGNVQVESDVVRGLVDVEGRGPEPRGVEGFSVVPFEPLADGWYVLRADLTEAIEQGIGPAASILGPRRGNVLHARFHVGSRLMWYRMHAYCGPSEDGRFRGCGYHFFLTEPVAADVLLAAAATIEVTYDGVPVNCTLPPPGIRDGELAVPIFRCPEPAQGSIVNVSMPSELIPDVRGTTETVVSFAYGGPEFEESMFEGATATADFIPHDDFGLEQDQPEP